MSVNHGKRPICTIAAVSLQFLLPYPKLGEIQFPLDFICKLQTRFLSESFKEHRLSKSFRYDGCDKVFLKVFKIFTLPTCEMSVFLKVSQPRFIHVSTFAHVWAFSRLQQLHHACQHAGHITDKPANRWKVTRPAHRNVLVMAARHQGSPQECHRALGLHLLGTSHHD